MNQKSGASMWAKNQENKPISITTDISFFIQTNIKPQRHEIVKNLSWRQTTAAKVVERRWRGGNDGRSNARREYSYYNSASLETMEVKEGVEL
ncbi:hypothetical protein LR48_Vigan08g057900 [Vigna angularis]|uniref:Uncharacterized protein n=1 Tax=Phaseolus angularis TaxID=3914 RepID=A0A0L9V483_PHAAN|nr:hypothetical protein LR48_Vigan08g057900 [Vigna angularis]